MMTYTIYFAGLTRLVFLLEGGGHAWPEELVLGQFSHALITEMCEVQLVHQPCPGLLGDEDLIVA